MSAFNALEYFVARYRERGRLYPRTLKSGFSQKQVRIVADDVDEKHYQPEWILQHTIAQFLTDFPQAAEAINPDDVHEFLKDLPQMLAVEDDVYEILSVGGSGKCARVYKSRERGRDSSRERDRGAEETATAVKVVLEGERANLFDIQVETARHLLLDSLELPCTPVKFTGSDFLIKPWVEGVVGSELVEERALTKTHLDALLGFIGRCVDAGLQIKDLKPRNMVFADGRWVCVDPGQLSMGHHHRTLFRYYGRYLLSHWFKMKPISMAYLHTWLRVVIGNRGN